jgi:hypothetical protein
MVAQNARTFLVVPNAEAENEVDKIKRTVEAPRILDSTIQNFKKERTKAREDFEKSLATAISGASFKVDDAIGSYNAWRATHDALEAKIKTAEALRPIIEKLLEELKGSHREALNAVIVQLENEAAAKDQKARSIKEQIACLEALLGESRRSSATAKSKKRQSKERP